MHGPAAYQVARATAATDAGPDKWDQLPPAAQTQLLRKHLPDPADQAAADVRNLHRATGAASSKTDPDISASIRPVTPADQERSMSWKKTHRQDGKPRVNNRTPVRTFRAPDPVWAAVEKHSAGYEGGKSEWLRHAIERYAKECDRQREYTKKRKGKKPAAAKV